MYVCMMSMCTHVIIFTKLLLYNSFVSFFSLFIMHIVQVISYSFLTVLFAFGCLGYS